LAPQFLDDRILVPLPHEQFVSVDHDDGWVLDQAWYSFLGYAATSTKPPVFMHRLIAERMGIDPAASIDHINMDKTDNRRCNLRPADKRLNSINRGKARGAFTSKYKGVHLHKASGMWAAKVKNHGVEHYLGYFRNEDDAARAYNQAAAELHGHDARLNAIEPAA
jgi:hypothetical protein